MYLLLYVHVCVTRTGWKTRPRPKTVILPIKKSNQIKSNLSSLSISLSVSLSVCLSVYRLVGLVVKVSASKAEVPGLESRLRRDFFGVESYQ